MLAQPSHLKMKQPESAKVASPLSLPLIEMTETLFLNKWAAQRKRAAHFFSKKRNG